MTILYFVPALRLVIGLLFIITGALKFPDLKSFSTIVASYNILPRKLVKPAAYTQPFMEFLVGWWVLSGKKLIYSSFAAFVLMVIADSFVLKALLDRKKMQNCGCYGVAFEVPLTWKKFWENMAWTVITVFLIWGAIVMQPYLY